MVIASSYKGIVISSYKQDRSRLMRNDRVDTAGARQSIDLPIGKAIIFSDGTGVNEILTAAEHPEREEWSLCGSDIKKSGLCGVDIEEWRLPGENPDDITEKAALQLQEYFHGKRKVFDIALSLTGTDFQIKVYRAMLDIPFGKTKSYGDVARAVGSPKGFRAVGGACHSNPIPFIVPCHRVIGSDGSLTGFGLGLDIKEFLLKLEGIEWK